jgi:flagellar biosynthesis protein FlhB
MAENKDGAEKSEQPSGKRLEEARRKGQVPLTRELPPLVVLLGGVGLISLWAPQALLELNRYQRHWFEQAGTLQLTPSSLHTLALEITEEIFIPLLPFGLAVAVMGAASLLVQTGPMWIDQALQPKPEKLHPKNGLKRIFSLKGVVDLLKSLLKLGGIGAILYFVLSREIGRILQFPLLNLVEAFAGVWGLVWKLVMSVGGALVILVILDFVYQRWQHYEDLKMTKQELKDESKDVEGDPQVRSRRLSLQRERSRQRMLQAVAKADVVITNPTHVAVALRYETGNMNAPVMVAKGAGFMADKIKQIARHAGVPIVENRSLARGLFKTVKVGQEIPSALYKAAAEVLAYVYRLKGIQEGKA